jgi:hypothetical protein
MHVKENWLKQCYEYLTNLHGMQLVGIPLFEKCDVPRRLSLISRIYEQFLVSDLQHIGTGRLPPNVDSMHGEKIAGPHILQVRFNSIASVLSC